MKRFSPKHKASCVAVALAFAGLMAPLMAQAQTRTNQTTGCQGNVVNYNPGNGEDIVVPEGYKVERFSQVDLNFPTAVAFIGDRLFATDSNQSIRTSGNNNSSRIVVVDISKNTVTPFITGLPTGDHPAEQLEFKDGWIYWSQGSTTNSSVVGHDNGGGANQQEIPCQDIVLSQNTFPSSDGHRSSGYSPHGIARPGAHVAAFESATGPGICSGSIMRAKLHSKHPKSTIEPVS